MAVWAAMADKALGVACSATGFVAALSGLAANFGPQADRGP